MDDGRWMMEDGSWEFWLDQFVTLSSVSWKSKFRRLKQIENNNRKS